MLTLRSYILTAIVTSLPVATFAQDTYDAQTFTRSGLNGTARFVSMGGALGALGADVSVMSTNPAGTALYRRSDVAATASLLFTDDKAMDQSSTRVSFDQIGTVIAFDVDAPSSTGVQFVNFGVNLNKKNNFFFNQATDIQHLNNTFSQTFQIGNLCADAFTNDYYGSMADMCAGIYKGNNRRGGLLYESYYHVADDGTETLLGNTLFRPSAGSSDIYLDPADNDKVNMIVYEGVPAQAAYYEKAERGYNNQMDINLSFNISDRVFLGTSVGVYTTDYTRESFYQEVGIDRTVYDLTNWYTTTAEGFDVKLGLIFRPFIDSPFRMGVSVHTPTWYRMIDSNGSQLFINDEFHAQCFNDEYEYDFRTPWKFGVSLGHTVGSSFAIGAEYEYSDLSAAHYSEVEGVNSSYFRNVNKKTEQTLKAQHTLKVGMEFKPIDSYSIRFGYNYVSSPIRDDAFRTIGYDSPFTETDFTNWGDTHRFCFGAGYSFRGGYIDLAYQYQTQKGKFYAFDDVDLKATDIKNNRSQVMATLGFRF